MASRPGIIRRIFGALWWLLDGTRRLVFNLLFLALLVLVVMAWTAGSRKPVLQENTALVLNLRGDLVEQASGSGSEILLAEALGQQRRETRVRDVLEALDAAAKDPKIVRVVLVLDDLSGGGTASLREIAAALARFKAQSGKEIVAWGSAFNQRQYFLASHADAVYLHPYGSVTLRGIGGNGLYFKEVLDKLGITMHGFQAGRFKSAIEPLTREGPSAESLEADQSWMDDLWASWTADVERVRKLPAGHIAGLIEEAPQRMAEAGGDLAQLVLKEKLIDGIQTRDEFRAMLIERGAASDGSKGTFRQVPYESYLAFALPRSGAHVGVIVAEGEILDDDAPPRMVGGRLVAEQIRRARENDDIKALVVRIDSPGGSVFGSELVRRELELTRQAGKPVVASMGDLAASGGYWIAMAADEIVADRIDRRLRRAADVRARPGEGRCRHRRRQHDLAGGRAGSVTAAGPSRRPDGADAHRSLLPALHRPGGGGARQYAREDQRSRAGPRVDRPPGQGQRARGHPRRPARGIGQCSAARQADRVSRHLPGTRAARPGSVAVDVLGADRCGRQG
jgi:protease IV